MKLPVVAVIMAGGIGERFWPYSTKETPKQLLTIFGKKPMIAETIDNLSPLVKRKDVYVSTNADLAKKIGKVVKGLKYVIEPMGRNTAACIGLSAISILRHHKDAVMVIETADHKYGSRKEYIAHLKSGIKSAMDDRIVLLGIKPSSPHTGYGYIMRGSSLVKGKIPVFTVAKFVEKPSLAKAKSYLKTGKYYWNSGVFIVKASTMLDEIKCYMPRLHQALTTIQKSKFSKVVLEREFKKLDKISIDYGVMEKSQRVAVIGAKLDWDDVGDWNAIARHFPMDKDGNYVRAEHTGIDTRDTTILADTKVATLGVKDLIIINSPNGLLVMHKSYASRLKEAVTRLSRRANDK